MHSNDGEGMCMRFEFESGPSGNEENPMLVSWRCLMCDFFVLKNEKLRPHHDDEV
jgi:hypothetical protein